LRHPLLLGWFVNGLLSGRCCGDGSLELARRYAKAMRSVHVAQDGRWDVTFSATA
jgi:hypothetical protein